MKLTQQQKDLFIGTLLGDANLQTESGGRTWRYRSIQKEAHKPYLDYKYNIVKDFCTSPPSYSKVFDERTNKVYKRWYFNTTMQSCFRFYGNMFYTYDPNTKKMVKEVPKNIQQFLTPAAIAYWYMDDGSLKWLGQSNAMRIWTECYSKQSVSYLQAALENLYDIPTTLTKKIKDVNGTRVLMGYRISINEGESSAFRKLIQPHLVDCMKYKVSDGNRGHL